MTPYLFSQDGELFLPTGLTRGPWTDTAMHGGPPSALLAHAIERERGDAGLFIARLTIDLFRPVPLKPLRLRSEVIREGRRIKLIDAYIVCEDGEVARASALLLRRQSGDAGETTLPAARAVPPWASVPTAHFSDEPPGDLERYHAGIDMRRMDTERPGAPAGAWMRMPMTLLAGTPLTPLQRVAGLADFASAMGVMSRSVRLPFINADVNIALHREPESEWICLETVGRGDHEGIASVSVHLHDERGLFGHAYANGLKAPSHSVGR